MLTGDIGEGQEMTDKENIDKYEAARRSLGHEKGERFEELTIRELNQDPLTPEESIEYDLLGLEFVSEIFKAQYTQEELLERFQHDLGEDEGKRYVELWLKDGLTPEEEEERSQLQKKVGKIREPYIPGRPPLYAQVVGGVAMNQAIDKGMSGEEAIFAAQAASHHAQGETEAEFLQGRDSQLAVTMKRAGMWPWQHGVN